MEDGRIDNVEFLGADAICEVPTYQEARDFIRGSLINMARNFIAIGYALKYIRDHELFREGGYASIWECACQEYGFSKSTASRYMSMNDRFSEAGNSPVIQEQYQGFSKSQLQEMLSLNDEQLGQVTPADRVEDIRAMKKSREIPYIEIPGQGSLEEYPGFYPKEMLGEEDGAQEQTASEEAEAMQPFTSTEPCMLTAAELVGEEPAEDVEKLPEGQTEGPAEGLAEAPVVAISQQTWREASGVYLHRPAEEQVPHALEYEEKSPISPIKRGCITGWSKYGNCVCCGQDGVQCCAERREDCNGRCGWIPEKGEEEEAVLEETAGQETETDLAILQEMLEKENKDLSDAIKINKIEPHPDWERMIRRKKLLVGALAGMLCDLEAVETSEQEGTEQPDLPQMKNNGQRREWLRNYKDWGLWYTDDHIGVRYYKYDFENGARLIVEEFSDPLPDGRQYESAFHHLIGGPKPPAHPKYGYGKWSWHKSYAHHPDSETELVEFLKEVQKK